ncbi:MAG: hypothetical protein WC346_16110 [Methanogenium sp.]|jgi:hypothetical protein
MTEAEAIVIVTREIKALSSNFDSDDYADAVDQAERDTGFSFPVTDSFQIDWLKKRTKRALFFSLLTENTESFKFKTINLQDKFKNLKDIVKIMDDEFKEALEEFADLFPSVGVLRGLDSHKLFGTKIDAGFAYDGQGRDITFDPDQLVQFSPNAADEEED